ncbi:MAG: nucleoside-diphosphate sugar epimerase/dehydratase, partial [Clostridia bacterium]
LIALPLAVFIYFIVFWLCRVPKVMWRYARGRDYMRIITASVLAVTIFAFVDQMANLVAKEGIIIPEIGESYKAYPTYIAIGFSTTATLLLSRLVYAFACSRIKDKRIPKLRKRTLIVGAGYTAHTILEELSRQVSIYDPVCMVDDDPKKLGRIINEVEVVGATKDIAMVVAKYSISNIIFAIPSLDEENRKRILRICNATNCQIKVMPYMSELIDNTNMTKQIRNIKIDDLLGRAQITFGDIGVASYLFDKVVLITGGGGSIGSELCRQVIKYKPRRLIIVDIYENCAYSIQQEIWRIYGKDYPLFVEIASVTDYDKMNDLFLQYKPQIIFHAAAHKHVPLMESNPEEAVKNNIFGTFNMATLANLHRVKKFIMISTDKAVNPTNIMGATKRCCEEIIQVISQTTTSTEFSAVRFGNVLGSNGSVIPLFKQQIEAGGPVTVTHKDVIRYFMTIAEAVSLVMQAGAFARGGEIFVLDMGEPVKITSVAENLISLMGYEPYKDIDIQFVGLRPGEKLYEEMLMNEEGLSKTANNKIFIGHQIELDKDKFVKELEKMRVICETNNKDDIIAQLQALVPTFHHDAAFRQEQKLAEAMCREKTL